MPCSQTTAMAKPQQAFHLCWMSASNCPPPMAPLALHSQLFLLAHSPRHGFTQVFRCTGQVAASSSSEQQWWCWGGQRTTGRGQHNRAVGEQCTIGGKLWGGQPMAIGYGERGREWGIDEVIWQCLQLWDPLPGREGGREGNCYRLPNACFALQTLGFLQCTGVSPSFQPAVSAVQKTAQLS